MDSLINYKNELNPAQYEAATTLEGPVLVIAGAGSGKTRTIVYRLVRLIESGVPASKILLLTFTRKAAQEMLERARQLLHDTKGMASLHEKDGEDSSTAHGGLASLQGGTFHAYAYSILRLFPPEGYAKNLVIMDGTDVLTALQHCKEQLQLGKRDRSFPKNQTVHSLLSKSRNKEADLEEILRRESYHLLPHAAAMDEIRVAYEEFKKQKSLLDYDDLLFCFEKLLRENDAALRYCRSKHQYIMIDEYQDTNPVQARIAALLAGAADQCATGESCVPGNIMVVGDDAQSIYAFRGADVRNILCFSEFFPGTKHIQLEENYRSTQPILDLTNAILAHASEGFAKKLFTRKEGGSKPVVVRPLSDRTQAGIVASRIIELMRVYPPDQIAVLFRAGFHSYALEVQLNKLGIRFKKYGGIRYAEAAHVKDVMSFMRLIVNPLDFTAFSRMADLTKGVGAKTALKIYQFLAAGDKEGLQKSVVRFPDLQKDCQLIDMCRSQELSPAATLSLVMEHYLPRLQTLYPDDYPRREQGLEQLLQIASAYNDMDMFIADLALDDALQKEEEDNTVVLSTVHSAKGLEWSAVLLLDLVEERFPSRQSITRPEDYEEERRLMYVACTRARECLELYVPSALYDRGSGGSIPSVPSPFIRELDPALYVEYQESYAGGLVLKENISSAARERLPSSRRGAECSGDFDGRNVRWDAEADSGVVSPVTRPEDCGYCQHKIFGRGKIVQYLPPDKVRVNFPGIGLKVILSAYITFEK